MDQLKAIDSFVRVARCGSLARAARELNLSRAAVSMQLRQLEDHLGVRLINRTTRALALTEAGSEYFAFCTKLLDSIDAEAAAMSRFHESPRGHLRIVVSASFGNFELAPLVAEFLATFPEVRVSLITTDTFVSPVEIAKRTYDVAVTMQGLADAATLSTRIGEVNWTVCASPNYLQRHGHPSGPAGLAEHNCLVHRSISPDSVWRLSGPDRIMEVPVAGSFFTNSAIALREMATAGIGIALLPTYCVQHDLTAKRLVEVLPGWAGPVRPVYALYSHARVPKKLRAFLDFTKARLHPRTSAFG